MSRVTCEHFVPIDLKCEKCDSIWETNIFELLRGYRNLVAELSPHLRTFVPIKEYEQWKYEWLDKFSKLEQKYKKLK